MVLSVVVSAAFLVGACGITNGTLLIPTHHNSDTNTLGYCLHPGDHYYFEGGIAPPIAMETFRAGANIPPGVRLYLIVRLFSQPPAIALAEMRIATPADGPPWLYENGAVDGYCQSTGIIDGIVITSPNQTVDQTTIRTPKDINDHACDGLGHFVNSVGRAQIEVAGLFSYNPSPFHPLVPGLGETVAGTGYAVFLQLNYKSQASDYVSFNNEIAIVVAQECHVSLPDSAGFIHFELLSADVYVIDGGTSLSTSPLYEIVLDDINPP